MTNDCKWVVFARLRSFARSATLAVSVVACFMRPVVADGRLASPQTVQDAISHLERVFGSYEPKDARQFRMTTDGEVKNQPEPTKPPVLVVSHSEAVVGTPYRVGDAVSFDLVELVRREIYAVPQKTARTLVRRQQRYIAGRWSLRHDETGVWQADLIFLVHSNPKLCGACYLIGTVNWLPNGVHIVGTARDSVYASDGSLIPVVVQGRITFIREGDELRIDDTWQNYGLRIERAGSAVVAPDFGRPLGAATTWLTGRAKRD